MSNKPTFLPVLLIMLIINAAGFFLRYFGLDTYFILIGFRFHFSLFISFLFILNYIDFNSVKEMIINPSKQRFVLILVLSFLPLLFIPIDFFILKQFKIAEQDYFFELGLSSIVDYPVYLVWNTPQLFMFFIFMNTILVSSKYKFIKASLFTLFLFLYEIIQLDALINYNDVNYAAVTSFIFAILLTGLFISLIKNIYLFTVVLFSVLWGTVLAFGSSSETIVNILLASQYENWGGFVRFGKKFAFNEYLLPAYLFLLIIFTILILKKNKISSAS